MSLSGDLAFLETDLRNEAATPGQYRRAAATPRTVALIVGREQQKQLDENGLESVVYEQQVIVPPADLGDWVAPQSGDRITYTDASGHTVKLEVCDNATGSCFRMTRSGRFFRVFTKRLV